MLSNSKFQPLLIKIFGSVEEIVLKVMSVHRADSDRQTASFCLLIPGKKKLAD